MTPHDHTCGRHAVPACDCPCTCRPNIATDLAASISAQIERDWEVIVDPPQADNDATVSVVATPDEIASSVMENVDMASIRRALGYVMATNEDTDPAPLTRLVQAWDSLTSPVCRWVASAEVDQ